MSGITGIVEPGLAAGALRTNAARLAGVFGKLPAITPTSSNPTRERAIRPFGQSIPGIVWQAAQPTRSIAIRPRSMAVLSK